MTRTFIAIAGGAALLTLSACGGGSGDEPAKPTEAAKTATAAPTQETPATQAATAKATAAATTATSAATASATAAASPTSAATTTVSKPTNGTAVDTAQVRARLAASSASLKADEAPAGGGTSNPSSQQKSIKDFRANYEMNASFDGEDMVLRLKAARRGTDYASEFRMVMDEGEFLFGNYRVDGQSYSCFALKEGDGEYGGFAGDVATCEREGDGDEDAEDFLPVFTDPAEILDELEDGGTITQTADDTIAGRKGDCYLLEDSEAKGRICIGNDDNLLLLIEGSYTSGDESGETFRLVLKDYTPNPTDADFKLPFKVAAP